MKNIIFIVILILIMPAHFSFAQEEQDNVSCWETLKNKFEELKSDNIEKSEKAKDWIVEDLKRIGDWDYKILSLDSSDIGLIEEKLKELGTERWECFWIDKKDNDLIFYLKKPQISYLQKIPKGDLIKIFDSLKPE